MVTMILIAVSRIPNSVESVTNLYFYISVLVMVIIIIIPGCMEFNQLKKLKNLPAKKNDWLIFIGIWFLPFLTFTIVMTNFYTGALIALALVKTFVDLRSFLRRQTPAKAEKDWVTYRRKDFLTQ